MKKIYWTSIRLIPFILLILFALSRIGQGSAQYETVTTFGRDIYYLFKKFTFNPIANILNQLFNKSYFLVESTYTKEILSGILSFELLISILELGHNIVMYLPKICTKTFKKGEEE